MLITLIDNRHQGFSTALRKTSSRVLRCGRRWRICSPPAAAASHRNCGEASTGSRTRSSSPWYLRRRSASTAVVTSGEAVRSIYLREHGVTYSQSVATLFVERLLDLLSMIVLASLVILVSPSYSWLLIGMAVVSIAGVVLIGRPGFPGWRGTRPIRRKRP